MRITHCRENVSDFGQTDKALALSIKGFESLHEVGQSAAVLFFREGFEDRDELLELIAFLSCQKYSFIFI